ncbi:ATP-binding protein [Marinobacterium lutimaris]|uniref:AAA domain-containing protein n=1 Tax=Marinobacterium lutimaris TaxID=568106 RepID=A0A1H6DX94_9GAMM|nr:AAA family ATPase [Marinobacterium lutimaris]SEG89336.1 hypothetical protein SAMN05444390_1122 [Marinobacterium lutimaris]
MIRNGFQRLVLLGSAGYQRAELPLDDAVSLIAPNNTGKTSLINALQFLLIIHKQRMDFGSHDEAKTRRFYFPNNSAYILLEVSLPQTGTVVFGCVGKGVSYEYDYFAYKGELVIEDYRLPEEHLVQQPQLISHLATKGRSVYQYDASEFIKRIYGGKQIERRNEPDFTIFKLENANNAQTFQQVLTRTLRLDKLTSADVKKYLLQIFKNDLPNHNINFKQVWDEAFHDVNADRAQYEAAVAQSRRIIELEHAYNERLMLRGKLIDWQGRVNSGLTSWQAHYLEQSQVLEQKDQDLRERQRAHNQRVQELAGTQSELKHDIAQLKLENSEQERLQGRFSLIHNRSVLQHQFDAAKKDWLDVSLILQQAGGRPIAAIMQAIKKQSRQLDTLEKQKQNSDDNLYRSLSKVLSDDDLQRLNRVISEHAMVLGSNEFTFDRACVKTLSDL